MASNWEFTCSGNKENLDVLLKMLKIKVLHAKLFLSEHY